MFKNLLNFRKKISGQSNFERVAEKQLAENMPAIKSLLDYDTGKKDISTVELERGLPSIRVTSRT